MKGLKINMDVVNCVLLVIILVLVIVCCVKREGFKDPSGVKGGVVGDPKDFDIPKHVKRHQFGHPGAGILGGHRKRLHSPAGGN